MFKKIRNAVGYAKLKDSLNSIEQRLVTDDCYWYEANTWEPNVLLALKDLCSPGMTVFDVGANLGGITRGMSRLVGPRGLVCAFEAAAGTFRHLQRNVVFQGLPNVMMFNRAVYSKSGEILTFFEGAHHAMSSLYSFPGATEAAYKVKTVALDDFCEQSSLYPDVIKMDIEGAEYDALLGAERMLDKVKPHLILELFPKIGVSCFNFLRAMGYVAIDCSNYTFSQTLEEFQSGSGARDILFLHESKLAATPYAFPIKKTLARKIGKQEFCSDFRGASAIVQLEPGRYCFSFNAQAHEKDNRMYAGVRQNGVILFYTISNAAHIVSGVREWMLDITSSDPLSIAFEFQEGFDKTFSLEEVSIYRFDDIRMPLWSTLAMD